MLNPPETIDLQADADSFRLPDSGDCGIMCVSRILSEKEVFKMRSRRFFAVFCAVLLSGMCFCGCREHSSAEPPAPETTAPPDAATEPFEAEGLRFSAKSGFYDTGFSLTVTASDGAPVHYTTDGSTPDAESPVFGKAIRIGDRSAEPDRLADRTDISPKGGDFESFPPLSPVEKATVIRAAAKKPDGTPGPSVTCTYFVGFGEKADFYKDMKIFSLVTDEGNLFDEQSGIYVLGKAHEDWKNSADYDPETPEYFMPANYTQRGKAWEREASLEIFENGKRTASQGVGIRIHGGASRSSSQKSFNVYARSAYGAPKLHYDLFAGAVKSEKSGEAITEFDSFMLRNGGNDAQYTRFRDRLNQTLVSDRQFLRQGMEPCILFINGEFWGQYDITERIGAAFVSTHCGVPKKDVCIIKKEELEAGDEAGFADWQALRDWIRQNDLTDRSAFNALCDRVDIQGFMDYVCTELYIANANWDDSNMAMWKASVTDASNPFADGKWRFILFDTDFSAGIYGTVNADSDSLTKLLESGCFLGDLLDAALKNEEFRQRFTETYSEIASVNFAAERVSAQIDCFAAQYRAPALATFDRFWSRWPGGSGAGQHFDKEVQSVRNFFTERAAWQLPL